MKLNTLLFTIMLGLSLTACQTSVTRPTVIEQPSGFPPTPEDGILYNCDSPYGKHLTFRESHRKETHPAAFPNLTVWEIEDVNGVHFLINEFEMKDYKCTTDKV